MNTSLSSLQPYSGEWETSHAVHLLSRTVFGATLDQIKTAELEGLEATVDRLFQTIPHPEPPVYYNFENDPLVENFETWVYAVPSNIPGQNGARKRSLTAWQMGHLQETGVNIREKMTLFWNEHFPVGSISSIRMLYTYLDLLRRQATGNVKELVYEMTVNPAMLTYLNGRDNVASAPNDNYSRELMELFTLGRGESIGEGDYTTYTEQDVEEISRALTGWRVRINEPDQLPTSFFSNPRHDQGTKQLSHRFDNVVIENQGEEEYRRVIDIIFEKPEVAAFICRKLHIWFVGSDINDDVELNIIQPLAENLIANNYDIADTLKTLFLSEYFNDTARRGCMLSSPIDFLLKVANTYKFTKAESIRGKYFIWLSLFNLASDLGMDFIQFPTVAGWKAYYQAPQFYQFWINSVTLNQRDSLLQTLVNGIPLGDEVLELDLIGFVAEIENATDPNAMIKGITDRSFVTGLSQNQLDYLKDVLIPGLPDFEWTVEYSEFLGEPDDPAKREAIKAKLKTLFNAILRMPEFSLM